MPHVSDPMRTIALAALFTVACSATVETAPAVDGDATAADAASSSSASAASSGSGSGSGGASSSASVTGSGGTADPCGYLPDPLVTQECDASPALPHGGGWPASCVYMVTGALFSIVCEPLGDGAAGWCCP